MNISSKSNQLIKTRVILHWANHTQEAGIPKNRIIFISPLTHTQTHTQSLYYPQIQVTQFVS